MNANELDMKVNQIRELKRIIEEAETEITSIEDTIKATMTERDTDELRGTECKVTCKCRGSPGCGGGGLPPLPLLPSCWPLSYGRGSCCP